MPYTISKDFEFCYGHRVWTQTLNGEYADDLKCACRRLHGHEAKVTVTLIAETLTNGMVTDFRHLEWLKQFLNTTLDHRFIIDINDPLYSKLVGDPPLTEVFVPGRDFIAGWNVNPQSYQNADPHVREFLESFFVVSFVPTSENLSSWLYDVVNNKMSQLNVETLGITWWETPKSRSVFQGY